jgi:glutathione synthase/RimK-type ligase-like ATP-grasp enzyme
MKKISVGYIFNENIPGLEDKIFFKLAKKKNINLIPINSAKDLNEEELKKKIKQCDIFYNNSAEEFSMELVKTIEELGKKFIDSSKKFYYDEDKWLFFIKCKKHKIPTLKTILLSENMNIAKRELKDFGSWPIILKRVEGTMGQYVDKANNLKQAEKIITSFWKNGKERLPIIAQEFMKSPSYRVTILGNKIIQTAIKECNHWKATGNYTTHFKKFEIDKELKKIIDKIIKVFDIKICGIDFFKKEGKWYVLEINSSPGLDFFENEREKLVGEVLNFFKKQVN